MNWILLVVAGLVAIILLVVLIGAALPRGHGASLEKRLPASAEDIWAIITGFDAFPSWRPDVTRVERLPDADGRPSWVEHSSSGRLTFVVDRMEPPRILVVRIADAGLPFGGTWTYEISPAAAGSTIRITERGEVYNPIFRFIAHFVFGPERTIRIYLDALERRVTTNQEQRHGI